MRRKKEEEKYALSSPAWVIRLEGMRNSVCIDSYFILKVFDPVRRILFLYPPKDCSPYPLSGAYLLKSDLSAEEVLELIREACEEAKRRVESISRRKSSSMSFFLTKGLPVPPSPEEKMRIEAHYAKELCSSVFGESYKEGFLLESRRMFINYIIGEKMSTGPSARIVKISSLDKGILEALADAINEVKRRGWRL
jgi:hypothetical protein